MKKVFRVPLLWLAMLTVLVVLVALLMFAVAASAAIIQPPVAGTGSVYTNRLLYSLAGDQTTNRIWYTNGTAAFGNVNTSQVNVKSNTSSHQWEWRSGSTVLATNTANRHFGVWKANAAGAATYGYTVVEPIADYTVRVDALGRVTAPANFATANSFGEGGTMSDAEFAARMSTNASGNALVSTIASNLTALARIDLIRKSREERLRQELVSNGFWPNLVYLQIFGRGYNNVTNPSTLQGPRVQWLGATNNLNGEWRGELTFTNSEYYLTNVNTPRLTNATLFAAWQGGQIGNAGAEKNILGIVAGNWSWSPGALRLLSSTAQTLQFSIVGTSQEIRTIPGAPYDAMRFFHVGISIEQTNKNFSVWTDGWMTNNLHATTAPYFEKVTLGNGSGGGLDALGIPDYNLRAHVAALAVFNQYYATNQLRTLEDIFKRTVLNNCRLVFEGDSIIGYTVNSTTPIHRIMGRSSWACSGDAFNISTGGNTIMDITNQWPAQLEVYARTNAQRRIVVLWAGANDFGNYTTGQRPNSEIISDLRKLWRQARELGFEVAACTCLRRISGTRATCLDDVIAVNTQIRADVGTYYDYLIDTDAYMEAAGGANYWTDTGFMSDGIHPTTEAAQEAIRKAFDSAGYNIFQ